MDLKTKEEMTGWGHMYSERRGELSVINMKEGRVLFTIHENEVGEDFSGWSESGLRMYLEENYRAEVLDHIL